MLRRVRNVLRDPTIIPRYLTIKRRRLYWRLHARRNSGIISIRIDNTNGFFAQLNWCLSIFAYCAEQNLIPHVVLTNPTYVNPDRGADWFPYFFTPVEPAYVDAHVVTTVRVRALAKLDLPSKGRMTIERAADLARKYLKVRQAIHDAVESFVGRHFAGSVVVGIHYRGTDKLREAPRLPYDDVGHAIRAHLLEHPEVDCLFVTTDEAPFIDYMRREFASNRLCYCDDLRSDNSAPVHRPSFAGEADRKGREALLSALLLSRCHSVIRTASALSGWASIFNPQLPVTMLTRPYDECLWFPDSDLVQQVRMWPSATPFGESKG